MEHLIPYKNLSKEVKNKIKEKKQEWISNKNIFIKLFSFRLNKVFLKLNGIEYIDNKPYQIWTIIYNKNIKHKNNTTFYIKLEEA